MHGFIVEVFGVVAWIGGHLVFEERGGCDPISGGSNFLLNLELVVNVFVQGDIFAGA